MDGNTYLIFRYIMILYLYHCNISLNLNTTIYTVGCPLKHKMSHRELLMGDMLCLYVGDP